MLIIIIIIIITTIIIIISLDKLRTQPTVLSTADSEVLMFSTAKEAMTPTLLNHGWQALEFHGDWRPNLNSVWQMPGEAHSTWHLVQEPKAEQNTQIE